MTLTTTASVAQAFFCLLLCIPWGSSCPRSCQCTERAGAKAVLCSSQHLQEIPKDIPRDTVLLKLDANSITRIPSNAFRRLSRLREMDLSRNAIEQIDRAAFRAMAGWVAMLAALVTGYARHNREHQHRPGGRASCRPQAEPQRAPGTEPLPRGLCLLRATPKHARKRDGVHRGLRARGEMRMVTPCFRRIDSSFHDTHHIKTIPKEQKKGFHQKAG